MTSGLRLGKSYLSLLLESVHQKALGKLNICTSVIYGGRAYSRRIIDELKRLKAENHKVILCVSIKADITWWQTFVATNAP